MLDATPLTDDNVLDVIKDTFDAHSMEIAMGLNGGAVGVEEVSDLRDILTVATALPYDHPDDKENAGNNINEFTDASTSIESKPSMNVKTFAEGVERLRTRNEKEFFNVGVNLDRLKNHSGKFPLNDELRMADDLFALTESETFSPIGISMTRKGEVTLGTTDIRGDKVEASFFNFSPSLDDGDRFVAFLHATSPDEVQGDVFAGDAIAWMVNDLRDQAELDILQAEKDKPVTPTLVTYADQVVSELKRLGFPPDSYDALDKLSTWAKKGVALEWILAKQTDLLDPVETNNMLDLFVDEPEVPLDDREKVQKTKLALAKIRWRQILETFNEVRDNPNAEELVVLMRNGAQKLLEHIRETPLGSEATIRTELDEIQLSFMDEDKTS